MLRFTIRELLLVTVIAGVAVAWWIDRNRLADFADERDLWTFRAESAAELIRIQGGQVDWNDDAITVMQIDSAGRRFERMKRRAPYAMPPAMAKARQGFPSAPVQSVSPGGK
jgi:hypothetical protein